jgi:hypothetical protein
VAVAAEDGRPEEPLNAADADGVFGLSGRRQAGVRPGQRRCGERGSSAHGPAKTALALIALPESGCRRIVNRGRRPAKGGVNNATALWRSGCARTEPRGA